SDTSIPGNSARHDTRIAPDGAIVAQSIEVARAMAFTTHVPTAPLNVAVRMLWDWQVEPGDFRLERILPQPGSGLILNLLEDQTRTYSDDAELRCERAPRAVFSGQFTRSF